jgi:beta-lactamase class A
VEGQLTSPLLACSDDPSELTIGARAKIEKKVTSYIATLQNNGSVTDVAVYFRDLNNGPWFGINERSDFTPGSLLKLPIALSLYYRAERDSAVFDTLLPFDGTVPLAFATLGQGEEDTLKKGTYTVHELISYMLRDSSNAAASLLVDYQGERLAWVFEDLGIEAPVDERYVTDVKTYGAFFRILYNASYLDQPASEEVLTTLTQSTFKDGLVAGVPQNVVIAHKFGTRVLQDGTRQLHDCGIVYAGESPYILCVMTQGRSVTELEKSISNISSIVYEGVAK